MSRWRSVLRFSMRVIQRPNAMAKTVDRPWLIPALTMAPVSAPPLMYRATPTQRASTTLARMARRVISRRVQMSGNAIACTKAPSGAARVTAVANAMVTTATTVAPREPSGTRAPTVNQKAR